MQILPADTAGIAAALEVLRAGGVVAHATETCYGFACDLTNPGAVKKLFVLKQRPLDQPVSALFTSVDDAKRYVEWNEEAQRLADEYLPGPLTLILQQKPITDYGLRITANSVIRNPQSAISIGVRISSHPIAHRLVAEFGSPLSTTSANLHGTPNPYSVKDIVRQFSNQEFQPDLILDSGALPRKQPSTVIDLTSGDTAKTLRTGDVSIA